MKRFFSVLAISVVSLALKAQSVTVITMDMLQSRSYELKAQVVDSLTNESLSFVSAYLKHTSDTLITNFALSDTEGNVTLTEVTTGDYTLTVEYLGYHKYQKNIYVRKDTDAGVIRLQPDMRILEAATVSAAGKEVEFKQDTIIFNATMFKTGSNDNLAALLKRMPGIEISKDGEVKVNGKSVDRITIEGKTFFLNDKSAALNNIPASIVDKIQVVDKDSDAAKISGIKDVQKERVMDVQLKEEYKKGFFGNIKAAGGSAVPGGNDNEFLVTDKALFSTSLLASYYDEKDQVTLISNAQNVTDGNSVIVVRYGDDQVATETLPTDGLHTSFSSGINVNTERIKNVSTTVFAKYAEDRVDRHSFSDRTSFQPQADDLRDKQDDFLTGTRRSTAVNAELKNTDGKVFSFGFTPSLEFSSLGSSGSTDASSYLEDRLSHESKSTTVKTSDALSASAKLNSSVKLPGNPRRRIGLNLTTSYGKGLGVERIDRTVDYMSAGTLRQALDYDKNNSYKSLNTSLSYSEPVSELWTMRLNVSSLFRYSSNDNVAMENGAYSSFYSSYSTTRYNSNTASLFGQYSKGTTTMSLGADLDVKQNWMKATSSGVETESGKGEWAYSLSPYVNLSTTSKDMKTTYYLSSSGSVQMPGVSSMLPSLSVASPTRLSLGNAYLKPYTTEYLMLSIEGSTPKKGNYSIYISNVYNLNSISNAIWYDSNSMMYSIPVNVKKPDASLSSYVSYGTPVTKDGKLRFNINASVGVQSGTSYQAKGPREGIDADNFDYASFMKEFWGNPEGDLFYSGASGFMESKTTQYSISVSPSIRLNLDNLQVNAVIYPYLNATKYSLDPKANLKTLDMEYSLDVSYQAKRDFEFHTDLEYDTFYGYKDMFATPMCKWNCSILKNVKAFTFGIEARDLLNSSRVQRQAISENYSQCSFTNTLGRSLLLSVKFNFGKMNAAKSSAATRASMKMAL